MRCKSPVLTENIASGLSSCVQTSLNPTKANIEKSLLSRIFPATRRKTVQWLSWVHSKRFKKDSSFTFSCDIYCCHLLCKYVDIQRHRSPLPLMRKRHRPMLQLYLTSVNHALAGKLVPQQLSWWGLLLFTGQTLISNAGKTGSQQFRQKTYGPQKPMFLSTFTL